MRIEKWSGVVGRATPAEVKRQMKLMMARIAADDEWVREWAWELSETYGPLTSLPFKALGETRGLPAGYQLVIIDSPTLLWAYMMEKAYAGNLEGQNRPDSQGSEDVGPADEAADC